ncbi:diguanylate cyclase domain-containing protein [Marinobacter metalliresistant]|uniref:diguanylate cyclase n=1 Tax=Marinobacter metalliresistant TaxID=2961995 RepID=A0ABZ2W104_9GAMM
MTFPLNEVEPADIHLLTGMLDTMADHVFSLRAEAGRYRLIYCNKAMDRFMNQADAMLCGRFLDEIVPDRDLYQRIADNYARARIAGHMIRYEETTEGFDSAPLTIFETSISPLTIRFSSGLATAPEHGFSPDELIDAADNALYRAKASGRDQLQMPGQPEPRQ